MKFLFFCSVFIVVSISAFCQKNHLHIYWNKNPENDILQYIIYKATDPIFFQELARSSSSETTYVDNNIAAGILYYYKIKALNTAGGMSKFSDVAQSAIPKIINLPQKISINEEKIWELNLDDKVIDPDDQVNTLKWKIEGQKRMRVTFVSDSIVKIEAPKNWIENETDTLNFMVTDPNGFFSQSKMIIEYGDFVDSEIDNAANEIIWIISDVFSLDEDIVFQYLPENCTIIINNSFGEEIFSITKLSESFAWDATDNNGDNVLFGLYIFKILDSKKKEIANGRFRVIPD